MADEVVELTDGEMTTGYHDHDEEFETVGGTIGYKIFADHINENVHLQVDIAWADDATRSSSSTGTAITFKRCI